MILTPLQKALVGLSLLFGVVVFHVGVVVVFSVVVVVFHVGVRV